MQIRFRLTLQFILIAAGILLASFFYVHFQFRKNLQDEFYENLPSKAYIIAEMVAGKNTDDLLSQKAIPIEPEHLTNSYTKNISIYKLDGTHIYTYNPAPDDVTSTTLNEITEMGECRFESNNNKAIGVLYQNRAGESFIVIAESMLDTV